MSIKALATLNAKVNEVLRKIVNLGAGASGEGGNGGGAEAAPAPAAKADNGGVAKKVANEPAADVDNTKKFDEDIAARGRRLQNELDAHNAQYGDRHASRRNPNAVTSPETRSSVHKDGQRRYKSRVNPKDPLNGLLWSQFKSKYKERFPNATVDDMAVIWNMNSESAIMTEIMTNYSDYSISEALENMIYDGYFDY